MILLIDMGNTRLKWGLADSAGVLLETGAFILADKDLSSNLPRDFDSSIIASVSTQKNQTQLASALEQLNGSKPVFVGVSNEYAGVQNNYKNKDNLGVDRWIAALAASKKYPNDDVIVIDAGTAVTVDYLRFDHTHRHHVFEGGAILPGYQLMHDCLVSRTAQISSRVENVASVIGADTMECVNSGARFGLTGGVDRVIKEMQALSKQKPKLLLCGGDAEKLASLSEHALQIEKDLVLLGLLNFICDHKQDGRI